MDTPRRIARQLLAVGAVKLQPQDPFTWASGLRSPIYCDNRVLLSYPDIRREIIEALGEAAGDMSSVEGIAGVATAGIPHGALLADRMGLPFVYVRSSNKEHGRRNRIEGRLEPGKRYLVVEDLISTGGSCLKAVEALRQAGAEIAGTVAIFTYQFPSAERAFQLAQVPLKTVSNYESLLEEATSSGAISGAEANALADWRQDPRAWSEQFTSQA
ncbi:orotate phosphoribosyltransferase [Neolewinella xylanilytica]|uniref:Orotate phosphoribosyltransferase n=1 Tax=Neolewinella xylanilytica TaxID=1514080 RepID=A0A2S6I3E1_9BACT|nr:orotate phosphoribosyltransferase [Neolewinella xylanilytica]PPK85702.1 orotate phosphoribosyltransferase [Neolewinella xylanilytica]